MEKSQNLRRTVSEAINLLEEGSGAATAALTYRDQFTARLGLD